MDSEAPRIEDDDLALSDEVVQARSYDVKVRPEVTELLRNKFMSSGYEDVSDEDRYPLAGIVKGVRKDTHMITTHPIGPKATIGGNEAVPFPQEKIQRIAGEMVNRIVSKNKALFGEEISVDSEQSTIEEITSYLEKGIYEFATFGGNDFYRMGFGIERWPSYIPLTEEQMDGVERRREFMLDVAEEAYKELIRNNVFSKFLDENEAKLDFSYEVGDDFVCLYIRIIKNRNGNKPENIAQITEIHEPMVTRTLDQAATPA